MGPWERFKPRARRMGFMQRYTDTPAPFAWQASPPQNPFASLLQQAASRAGLLAKHWHTAKAPLTNSC